MEASRRHFIFYSICVTPLMPCKPWLNVKAEERVFICRARRLRTLIENKTMLLTRCH